MARCAIFDGWPVSQTQPPLIADPERRSIGHPLGRFGPVRRVALSDVVFEDRWGQAMTLAVVDRLVHHATIFDINVESYRRRAALERKRGPS